MQVIAYLNFDGNCEEALNFYQSALDGKIVGVLKAGDSPMKVDDADKNKIMHARMQLGESIIYFSDSFGQNKLTNGDNIHLSLQLNDVNAAERYFTNLSAGGTIVRPLEDTFWGARFGMLIDKFGFHWMINCELKNE